MLRVAQDLGLGGVLLAPDPFFFQLVDKSAEVERFFRSKVATRSSWRQAVAVSRTAARAGSAAGRKAVLSSPNALGSSKGYLGAG